MNDPRSDLQRELEAATSRPPHGASPLGWERGGLQGTGPTARSAPERQGDWDDESRQWREGWTALVQLLEEAELDAGPETALLAQVSRLHDHRGIEASGEPVAERWERRQRAMGSTSWRGGGSLLLLALAVGCGVAGWAGVRWSLDRETEPVAGRAAAVETRALVAMVPRAGSPRDGVAADGVVRDPTVEDDSGWDESAWNDAAWEAEVDSARVALWQVGDRVGESDVRWSSVRDQLAWMEQELAHESL